VEPSEYFAKISENLWLGFKDLRQTPLGDGWLSPFNHQGAPYAENLWYVSTEIGFHILPYTGQVESLGFHQVVFSGDVKFEIGKPGAVFAGLVLARAEKMLIPSMILHPFRTSCRSFMFPHEQWKWLQGVSGVDSEGRTR